MDRTVDQQRNYLQHQQRLREIDMGRRRSALGDKWRQGPLASRPAYAHVRQNLKRAQLQNERYDAIERENRILLHKMSALMTAGSVIDPTEGTWEFSPGVRLNRFQVPVVDHGISLQPRMPQRGAAREPESLNSGARRRELERITNENRGIVHRIQERGSQFSRAQWQQRSDEHDSLLLRISRPATSHDLPIPLTASQLLASNGSHRSASSQSARGEPSSGHGRPSRSQRTAHAPVTKLLTPTAVGATQLHVGICPGFVRGATLIVQPGEVEEEQVVIEDVALKRGGLYATLVDPCRCAHPVGVYVHVYPEAEVHFNKARLHLDESSHLMDEEVTARIE